MTSRCVRWSSADVSAAALTPLARSGADLVVHQRDQRRDHEASARARDRRHLVADRLAGAGWHDREHVAAVAYVADDRLLLAAEGRKAEDVVENLVGRTRGGHAAPEIATAEPFCYVAPMRPIVLIVALSILACAPSSADPGPGLRPVAVESKPVALDTGDPSRDRVGRLRYLGGIELKSPDPRFGGLSGLRVWSPGKLMAVTDGGPLGALRAARGRRPASWRRKRRHGPDPRSLA